MNIDPDKMSVCTAKKIMESLDDGDLDIFKKRKDATDVVLIDDHTDDISRLAQPKSKVSRIISALTKFDHQIDEKIVVPVHILEGGFSEWLLKYPHFTTNPQNSPGSQTAAPTKDTKINPMSPRAEMNHRIPVTKINDVNPPRPHIIPQNPIIPQTNPINVIKPSYAGDIDNSVASRPIPTRPPPAKPPINIKNAPGTAIPVTPILSLRSALPRSHSSPNVAQPEDEGQLNMLTNQFDQQLTSNHGRILSPPTNILNSLENNINHPSRLYDNHPSAAPACPPISPPNTDRILFPNNTITNQAIATIPSKPKFDRNLKPAFNNEYVNAIRAQLNFGRSPESSGKAITGLQNLGNTCFMNSVIQCLAYVPALFAYICSQNYLEHINFNSQYGSKGELAVELGALIERLNAHKHRYIEPKSFRECVVKHVGFAGNEQQDSHEFMMMLFEKLHHDLNIHGKEKIKYQNGTNDDNNINIPRTTLGYQFWRRHLEMNKSIISDLFEGIFMSTLTCAHCQGQSNTFEVFNCLSLPIPSESRCHLRDCLNHFSNPERIEAAWECPRCKQKREADKKIVICKLPKVLIIHLKRFSLDGRWRQKLQTTVDFPLTDLSVDCTNVLPQSAYGSMPLKSSYELIAVVNHYGHLDGGHYTAFCKLENQRWYTFDDSNVNEMKDSDVCGQAAYLLFYASIY